MVSLLVAESAVFLVPMYIALKGKEVVPYQAGTNLLSFAYLAVVIILALVAMTAISFNWLLAIHLVALLGFVVAIGGVAMGGNMIADDQQQMKQDRASLIVFKNQFQGLCDRIALLEGDIFKGLLNSYSEFKSEKLAYATSESIAGSEAVDAEMNSCLDDISNEISKLERTAKDEETEDKDKVLADIVSDLDNSLKKLGLIVDRREQLMVQLR